MTLPTRITVLRIFLTFVIVVLLFVPGVLAKSLSLVLFFVAAGTDWLDGYLARRLNQVSPRGVLLDPIADKILVLGLLLTFVWLGVVRGWMVLVIVIRELLVTGVRLFAANRHVVIPAAREGKHKTVSQMVTICVVLAALLVRELRTTDGPGALERWMEPAILWCMWITVGLTVISGVSFFWRNRSVFTHASVR